jgi:hypothetical protein
MIIKTKKYQLPKNTYIQIALMSILKKQWWFVGGPILFGAIAFALPVYKWWFIVTAILAVVLYILFWAIQFVGVTQLPQNQVMFDKLSYEIDSRQIMIKVDPKRGSPIGWDMIKEAYIKKDHFLFMINKAQMIYLPYKIFNSDYEIKFVETIMKRKDFVKESK